ncbi:DUF4826 family protein [Aliidiomarina celeris]|uniref:DUF4826 family protein n=1 Tax=Aliidiomarina celeris TaxID=2249428 RepID=UPI0013002D08|nr:DUF4826 family protein [Aliidiomarina celeris]
MTEQYQAMTEEQHNEWVREKFQAANAFLAQHGVLTERVLTKDSRYMAPLVAIWKFSIQGVTDKVWAVSGEVPTDYMDASAAATPRDALRYFCYRWQQKADMILNGDTPPDAQQKAIAEEFIKNAERLYPLTENNAMWEEEV